MTDRKYQTGMRTGKRFRWIVFLAFFTGAILPAQNLPVVYAYSLESTDTSDPVYLSVNDLIFSFIQELRTYRIIDKRPESVLPDTPVPAGADYLFFGSLNRQQDGIKLELVLKGGPMAITRLISRVYDNSNRILLESRMLVRDLFDQSVRLPDSGTNTAKAVIPESGTDLVPVADTDSLAGSWHGEQGIEKVMLLRGGRGLAILTSGVSLPLELSLSDGNLIIKQKGIVSSRQFIDLPEPVARQAANIAPPLEWIFLVSGDQKTLKGKKKSVLIKNDGKNILSMENVTTEVVWTRDN
jgi:hypothetical protein